VTDGPEQHAPRAGAGGGFGAPVEEGERDETLLPAPENGSEVVEHTGLPNGAGQDQELLTPGSGEDDELYEGPFGEGDDEPYEDGYDQSYEEAYDQPYADGDEEPYEGPPRGPIGESRIRRRRRRRFAAVGGALLAVIVIVGIVGFIKVSHDIHPTGAVGAPVNVDIPIGASTEKIGDVLAKADVIHGPLVFSLYVKLEGAGPFMPGTYRLATNQPYSSAVYALEKGPPPVIDKLVVPEGFTIRKIAAAVGRLRGIGISSHAFMEAATSGQVRSPYEPAGTNNLEGFLFPATYPVQTGETADDLVQYMVDTFDHYASQLDLSAKAARLHYTPYQVLNVASIVEREAKFESDRALIASAIYNRLAGGIPIGAESTLLYALGDPKGPVNMEARNPYNTLINKGLPPTPISNPGIPSLKAALSPAKTDYLFWVEINPDGQMGYASDEAGFAQLQVECKRAHLC
jgi:UPF0755 protein